MTASAALPSDFAIGPMRPDELRVLDDWAAQEGWNPGRADLNIAAAVDPGAFIALRQDGALAGGGSIFRHDDGFGFMGLFIMRADLRGQGLGARLWRWRLEALQRRLRPGATIAMDGVYAMTPFYERGGFVAAHRHVRFEGVAAGVARPGISDLDGEDMAGVAAIDAACFPANRQAFLRLWIGQPGAHAVGWREHGVLRAYGVARPCRVGFKIGPLYADDAPAAESVLSTLLARIAGQRVQIDIPEPNAEAVRMAQRHGLSESFGCVRLYHGPDPKLPLERIFATTSLEFG